jgi:hypothetical protein
MPKKSDDTNENRLDKITEAAKEIAKHQTVEVPPVKTSARNDKAVGVDIGTSKIVFAENGNNGMIFHSQTNAFIEVDYSRFTERIMKKNNILHQKVDDALIVYGDGAEIFANMLNAETRRPMRKGLLNPTEARALDIIKGILDDLVKTIAPRTPQLCFSIPGAPEDAETDIIYHETILKRHLDQKGYCVKSINEGQAVIFSELENENFSGIGISAGGGMCNVCLSFLSVPLLSYSITKGGDYIDDAVSSVTGEVNTRVRDVKENELDLRKSPKNAIEDALHIYYDDLIQTLVTSIKDNIDRTSKIPKVEQPVPIVLSGGTVMPPGFKERFESFMDRDTFPIPINGVRIAEDPLTATARGSLIAAMYES